jgi:hypothetical protein
LNRKKPTLPLRLFLFELFATFTILLLKTQKENLGLWNLDHKVFVFAHRHLSFVFFQLNSAPILFITQIVQLANYSSNFTRAVV